MSYTLPANTHRRGNGIAVDPAGCLCGECKDGRAIPADSPDLSAAITAALRQGRPIFNCTDDDLEVLLSVTLTTDSDFVLKVP